mgnify:CR=1 FL=1
MNMPPDGFADESGPPDGFEDQPQAQPQSMMQSAKTMFGRYQDTQRLSPQTLLNDAYGYIQKGAGKAGEYVTEQMSKPVVQNVPFMKNPVRTELPPQVPAAVGTLVAMGPDIAMAGINPLAQEAALSRAVPSSAIPLARRSMGFQKSFLKTPFARGQADKAAEIALSENVIPVSGNPETALRNATDLANKTGQKIGKTLEETPIDLNQTFDDLENLRSQITQGLSDQGVMSKAHNAIDSIQNDIIELGSMGKKVNASFLTKIKNRVGNSINYLNDLTSQSDNKAITTTLANSIRSFVKAVQSPEAYNAFIKNQRLFSASKLMQKGLNNEVAGQVGNRMFSPYSVVGAGAQLAAGRPAAAGMSLLGIEGGLRRGAGTAARLLTEGRRAAPAVPEIASKVATILTKDKAKEFLDQANGDKDEARKLAREAGYTW